MFSPSWDVKRDAYNLLRLVTSCKSAWNFTSIPPSPLHGMKLKHMVFNVSDPFVKLRALFIIPFTFSVFLLTLLCAGMG